MHIWICAMVIISSRQLRIRNRGRLCSFLFGMELTMFKEVNEWGDIFYYKDAELTIRHREDGPAFERSNGDKCWYSNGQLHRVDGPAVEWVDGDKAWWLNGKRHRIDGPAVEGLDGFKAWWLNDEHMDFQEWKKEVRKYYDNQEDYLLMLLKLD